jgi:hypothetical protein
LVLFWWWVEVVSPIFCWLKSSLWSTCWSKWLVKVLNFWVS